MNVSRPPEVCVPYLLSVMPGEYSLGVPIEDGAIRVRTSAEPSHNNVSRLHVIGTEEEIEIEREDEAALQVIAYDRRLGITAIFAEPINRLTIAYVGGSKSRDVWAPITEGLTLVSEEGFTQFLIAIAKEAHFKKISKKLSSSF